METSQNTLLYHDDLRAQMLLERIKEKMVRTQLMREEASEPIQSLELNQKGQQFRN